MDAYRIALFAIGAVVTLGALLVLLAGTGFAAWAGWAAGLAVAFLALGAFLAGMAAGAGRIRVERPAPAAVAPVVTDARIERDTRLVRGSDGRAHRVTTVHERRVVHPSEAEGWSAGRGSGGLA